MPELFVFLRYMNYSVTGTPVHPMTGNHQIRKMGLLLQKKKTSIWPTFTRGEDDKEWGQGLRYWDVELLKSITDE